jgi:hypothetical protein
MARNRQKSKGRSESGSFCALPHSILGSREYATLSAKAVKCLLDIFSQFRGSNNGDMGANWKEMSKRGWKSRDTLDRALLELIEAGFILKTRQGGRRKCSLYAVTWLAIDECGGKLDVPPTRVAPNMWRTAKAASPIAQLDRQCSRVA